MKQFVKLGFITFCLIFPSGCDDGPYNAFDPDQHPIVDPEKQLTRMDYQDMYVPRPVMGPDGRPLPQGVAEPPVPELAEILAAPKPPKIGQAKLVSVAVTDDVPLKDVLIELARLADVDIEVDAGITGGIGFRAKDRPFNEVIDRIADMAGLRYTMKNNVLRVERDTPYIQIYAIDFLNIERTATSSMNISTSVLSSGSTGGGGGLSTGSQAGVSSKIDNDFWKKFEDGIGRILSYQPTSRLSGAVMSDQPASPVAAVPAPDDSAAGNASASDSGGGAAAAGGGDRPFYILNRQGATLTVSANDRQHRLIKEFVRKIQANASSQVLIEAKIVEVTLNEEFQSGINWSRIGNDVLNTSFQFGAVTSADNFLTLNFSKNDLTGEDIDLDAVVQLTEIFGTTRTLSSPRLHATNNQQAILTFAENQVYFEIEIERTDNNNAGGTTTDTEVTSTVHTVPIGIILALQPSINSETNEVTLSVRPTLSRITGFVTDPAVAFLAATLDEGSDALINRIPIVEVRELDSILKLKSGQVMVIGGLMENRMISDDNGVPGLGRVPVVGNLFRGINRDHETRELVIFIRARVVDTGGNSDNADKTVYEKFMQDPRPLTF